MGQVKSNMHQAFDLIGNAKNLVIFTGAGISVESGIRPFRGVNGIYADFGPNLFEKSWYFNNMEKARDLYNKIFYKDSYEPNEAHKVVAKLNKRGVITMNVDNLHQEAGDTDVVEFHGNTKAMKCIKCHKEYPIVDKIDRLICECGRKLKPTLVMFGDPIDKRVLKKSDWWLFEADVILAIGSTGEVDPACGMVKDAQREGSTLIEINIGESRFSPDYFLQGPSSKIMKLLEEYLEL